MKSKPTPIQQYKFIRVADLTASLTGVSADELKGRKRCRRIARSRSFAAFLLYEMDVPMSRIGGLMNKDHTSVRLCISRFRDAFDRKDDWARSAMHFLGEQS